MASLHAIHTQHGSPAYAQCFYAHQSRIEQLSPVQASKWTYLIAEHINFKNDTPCPSIKLQKPDNETLYVWLEKIICAGQTQLIFVEELTLDDLSSLRIKQLCVQHHVTLVNLTLEQGLSNNLVQGPW